MALGADETGPVHGYFTVEDRDALLAHLDPGPEDLLLDLGCGTGGVAIDLHRRSGAAILGVDISPEAVSAARDASRRAGTAEAVRFRVGDLASPPRVGATGAYALDSLMFAPDLEETLRGINAALRPGGRLFATLLMVGSGSGSRLRASIVAAGVQPVRLDEVTTALSVSSRARAERATAVLRGGDTSSRGRLAMRLVIAEERLIEFLIGRNQVSRWRFVAHVKEND